VVRYQIFYITQCVGYDIEERSRNTATSIFGIKSCIDFDFCRGGIDIKTPVYTTWPSCQMSLSNTQSRELW